MVKMRSKVKVASRILKVGANKVWVDPENLKRFDEAITAEDIRKLIDEGVIRKKEKRGQSRARAKKLAEQKKRGRRKGRGSRKGKKTARGNGKRSWILKIRALRKELKSWKDSKKISPDVYWKFYKMAKGNFFRNKAHMRIYLEKFISGGDHEVGKNLQAEIEKEV